MIFDNKLSQSEREDYKLLKVQFKSRNLQFIQDPISGVTIAKCDHGGGNFCRVAIAYCNALDKFSKKRGKFEALLRLHDNEYMLLPKYIGPEYEFICENI